MASSYSTDLKLELMVTGENAGTWGDKTNTNLNLLQQAIAGFESITITDSATTTLTMSDAAISNARNMVLKIATVTLSGATTLALPDGIEKFYILDATAVTNPTNLTFKTTSGTGFTLDAAKIYAAYSDGTNINEVSLDTLGGTVGSAQIADNSVTSAKISSNAVTTAKISNANVTTAKIADNAITTDKISALQVTQAKIANDAVGPDQLSNTAVTAGSYDLASITVDAQGRITAASTGSAGGANMIPTFRANSSGNFTAQSNANAILVYARGGGGGASGNWSSGGHTGRPGGIGGSAVTYASITQPYTQPFTLGNGGSGGPAQSNGSAGNATNFGSPAILTVNGGNGANTSSNNPGGIGNPGGAPLATVNLAPLMQYTSGSQNVTEFAFPASGNRGNGGTSPGNAYQQGNPGGVGCVIVYENLGG